MASGQRVLVVDEYSEMADVLQAVLEPRGVRVERALARAVNPIEPGPSAERPVPFSVIVVDRETAAGQGVNPGDWRDVPKVLIGTVSMPASEVASGGVPERHLRKPFHYAELIRAIETLIADAPHLHDSVR